jgi:hypothetical protein
MAQALAIAATAITAVGTLVGGAVEADAARAEGKAAQQIANFQARQMEQQAGQERAVSQREAIEQRRRARLAQSRALAIAAASGGGTGGTVQDILATLGAEGEMNAQAALYEGEEAARGLETQAAATRSQGRYANVSSRTAARNMRVSSYLSAAGTLMSDGSSFYSKYWPDDENTGGGSVTMVKSGSKFGRRSSQVAYG